MKKDGDPWGPLRRRNGQDRRRRDQARLRGARRISYPDFHSATRTIFPSSRFPFSSRPCVLVCRVPQSLHSFPPPPCVFVPSYLLAPIRVLTPPLLLHPSPFHPPVGISSLLLYLSSLPFSSFLRTGISCLSRLSPSSLSPDSRTLRPRPSSSKFARSPLPVPLSAPSLSLSLGQPSPPPRSRWRAAGSPAKTSIRQSPVAPWYTDRART